MDIFIYILTVEQNTDTYIYILTVEQNTDIYILTVEQNTGTSDIHLQRCVKHVVFCFFFRSSSCLLPIIQAQFGSTSHYITSLKPNHSYCQIIVSSNNRKVSGV